MIFRYPESCFLSYLCGSGCVHFVFGLLEPEALLKQFCANGRLEKEVNCKQNHVGDSRQPKPVIVTFSFFLHRVEYSVSLCPLEHLPHK